MRTALILPLFFVLGCASDYVAKFQNSNSQDSRSQNSKFQNLKSSAIQVDAKVNSKISDKHYSLVEYKIKNTFKSFKQINKFDLYIGEAKTQPLNYEELKSWFEERRNFFRKKGKKYVFESFMKKQFGEVEIKHFNEFIIDGLKIAPESTIIRYAVIKTPIIIKSDKEKMMAGKSLWDKDHKESISTSVGTKLTVSLKVDKKEEKVELQF